MAHNRSEALKDETRYLSHAEFSFLLLEHGITKVTFEYEDADPEGNLRHIMLLNAAGDASENPLPDNLREALAQRLTDNFLCHHRGKYLGCGAIPFEWDLTAS